VEREEAAGTEGLVTAMRHSLLAGGKRIRPVLALATCQALGRDPAELMPAAAAIELVHTYSLIHDDLPAMDDDDLRRGLPTCHKKFGEALAILAGDSLLTLAFQILGSSYGPATAAVSCVELAIGAGARGMVGGQVLDLAAEGRITGIEATPELETIHRLKTGALFRSALRLGFYAAQTVTPSGFSPEKFQAIDDYAAAFGLAFQVTDDLLDVESSAEKTGKQVNKDAGRGKLTYPALLGIPESRARAEALGNDAVAAAEKLGPNAGPLADLARYVVTRDR